MLYNVFAQYIVLTNLRLGGTMQNYDYIKSIIKKYSLLFANSSVSVGIYVRLSKDDGNLKISESIRNQIDYLINYALEHHWHIVKIYSDDRLYWYEF